MDTPDSAGALSTLCATDPGVLAYSSELSRHQRSAANSSDIFENAPSQGMRDRIYRKSGNPLMNISHDVGYSPRIITINLLRQVFLWGANNMAFLSTGWRGRLRDASFRGVPSPLKMMNLWTPRTGT